MSSSLKSNPAGKDLLRGVFALTAGTAFSRVIASVSQFILVIWLTPRDFGLWAAATSALVFLSGLVNLGEVSGYLSGQSGSFEATRRVTRKVNWALTALGLMYSLYCIEYRSPELGALCAAISLTFPILGESTLLSAAATKAGSYRQVVSSQMMGAIMKLAIGVGLAATTRSPLAIAISTAAFSATVCVVLYKNVPIRKYTGSAAVDAGHVSIATRVKWSVNSLMMTLPIQAGFLVAQFLSSLSLLGVYFVSYQITLGLSGLLAEPLSRVGISALARERDFDKRTELATWLCKVFGAAVLAAVSLAGLLIPHIYFLPKKWESAVPMTLILLSSLPIRMMSPIIDSIQQVNNKWWQATAFNTVDAVGTAAASVSILYGDARILAVCVAAWKIFFGAMRLYFVLGRRAPAGYLAIILPMVIGTALVGAAPIMGIFQAWWLPTAALLVGAGLLANALFFAPRSV